MCTFVGTQNLSSQGDEGVAPTEEVALLRKNAEALRWGSQLVGRDLPQRLSESVNIYIATYNNSQMTAMD